MILLVDEDNRVKYHLVSDRAECGGSEVGNPRKPLTFDVWNCADMCRDRSTMFAFGTNDYNRDRCYPDNPHPAKGCACLCETAADSDGKCGIGGHDGYRLYRIENGINKGGMKKLFKFYFLDY